MYSPIPFRELDLVEHVPDVLLELLANRGATRVRGPCRVDQICSPPDDFGAAQRSRRHRSTPCSHNIRSLTERKLGVTCLIIPSLTTGHRQPESLARP